MSDCKALLRQYNKLLNLLEINESVTNKNMNQQIRKALHDFCDGCENPAIWCMGVHTQMLMADFMNELKKVQFVVDQNKSNQVNTGIQIITENQLRECLVDGVIISSYRYRNEIKALLKEKYPNIRFLDLYDYLSRQGISLVQEYYLVTHPYKRYKQINRLQTELQAEDDVHKKSQILLNLIREYVVIKDFKSAIRYITILCEICPSNDNENILHFVEGIYEKELSLMQANSAQHVLMLCIDGLRRKDVLGGKMPAFLNWLSNDTCFFQNAYSKSTSTYESLIPVYRENDDLRTEYYKNNSVSLDECRFIKHALNQERKIYFYTDTDDFIECDQIVRSGKSQTISEKIWDFVIDANECTKGLFYLHILYESHYSYPNPYTQTDIVADGSNIMFDFTDLKGNQLRTNYENQQGDALRYIDDMLTPLLVRLNCRVVVYADHGNILLSQKEDIHKMKTSKFSYDDDLIQIPMAVKSPDHERGKDNHLISLMELNQIVIDMMDEKKYTLINKNYIKVVRSQIYNPDFKYIYHICGKEQELNAFEMFIFDNHYQFIVYANGVKVLLLRDEQIMNQAMINTYYEMIKKEITVCDCD